MKNLLRTKHFRLTASDEAELQRVCEFYRCKSSEAIRRLIRGHGVILHRGLERSAQEPRISGGWSGPKQSITQQL